MNMTCKMFVVPKQVCAVIFASVFLMLQPSLFAHADTCKSQFSSAPFDEVRILRAEGNESAADAILDSVTDALEVGPIKSMRSLGGGVNDSYKLKYEDGTRAVYKPLNPDRKNLVIRERAAYRLSRLLGLDIVPPTVVRSLSRQGLSSRYPRRRGSVQLFISTAMPLQKGRDAEGNRILLKDGKPFDIEDHLSGRRLIIFDWLINNHDRGSNAGNYMVSNSDGYIFGIDHSVSFVGHKKRAREDKVPYYRREFLNDPEMFNRLTSASRQEIEYALRDLNPVRVTEFFERYDKLIQDFKDELAKSHSN